MVLLGVESEGEIVNWSRRCEEAGIHHEVFREPDRNNEATALAAMPSEEDGKLFRKIRLL
jgi:hypothetical protein